MNPIKSNAFKILKIMIDNNLKDATGDKIKEMTKLDPEDINDAVDYLEHLEAIEANKILGTHPYNFYSIIITSQGKHLYYEMNKQNGSTLENQIKINALKIFEAIIEKGIREIENTEIKEMTKLDPEDINDAVDYLEHLGAIEANKFLGTHPYNFYSIIITSRGKYLYYEMQNKINKEKTTFNNTSFDSSKVFNPVGSPYGFTANDWKSVASNKEDKDTLYVVLGLQYESEHYNIKQLEENIEQHFQNALALYNKDNSRTIKLRFKKLAAGYGEHVFNTIAKDIIGSDIAIFEISDYNPNVMIELGVALTWGIHVLPLREKNAPKLPSDISGQTWIEYEDSCTNVSGVNNKEFHNKLRDLIDKTVSKK